MKQRTLKSSIGCTGIGLHSGNKVSMNLHPADAGTGIIFRRVDRVSGHRDVEASWRNVVDSRMATTVGNDDDVRVATVEHLMAAFAGCAIDNAVVEIDGPEVPIMDGSAAPFVFLIECAGIVEQKARRRAIRILKPVRVGDRRKSITLSPAEDFSVSFAIQFDSAVISAQEFSLQLINGNFKTDIARARTFGFEHEVVRLRKAGLARGGSLDNAVVISGDTVLNGDGLRYRDEFVRHKILDCIGDLYLAGAPIIGHVDGLRSGHTLNHALLEALFEDAKAWTYSNRHQDVRPPLAGDLEAEALAAPAIA
jgi:UDP-3-O-[3-hydroxymyristoyl] N-acetylglucosamine deacetylase